MKEKTPVTRLTLSVAEAAAALGVHSDSVYEMVRKKQIPHIRVQSRILFRLESLDAWMAEQEELNSVVS